jgi:hypothetical protein
MGRPPGHHRRRPTLTSYEEGSLVVYRDRLLYHFELDPNTNELDLAVLSKDAEADPCKVHLQPALPPVNRIRPGAGPDPLAMCLPHISLTTEVGCAADCIIFQGSLVIARMRTDYVVLIIEGKAVL